jgi:hypothetical protein
MVESRSGTTTGGDNTRTPGTRDPCIPQNIEIASQGGLGEAVSQGVQCEHTRILGALVEHPQGNLEEIQQKTLQSTQEEPVGRLDRKT